MVIAGGAIASGAIGGLPLVIGSTPASQTNTASGSLVFNGAGSFTSGVTLTSSGSLLFSGEAASNNGIYLASSGALNFNGAASESHSGVQSLTVNAAGAINFSGDALTSKGVNMSASGTISFGQGAQIAVGITKTQQGSLLFSGAAGMSSGGPASPSSDLNWRTRGYGR